MHFDKIQCLKKLIPAPLALESDGIAETMVFPKKLLFTPNLIK
jgi:hypothetical protein